VSLAGPVLALTSGGTASVPAPKVPTPPCTVLLQNVSPYALQAQIQGGTVWIPPYTQQSVPWSNSVGVTVSAEPVITSPSGAPASLLVTFYNQGEVVPPNGPITGYTSITGAVVNATISGPVTVSGTVAISSGTVDVGTVAGSISIAAGQVVQVENVPAGTVVVGGTVAISSGTINVGTISGSISIAAGQVVQVENVPAGTVVVGGTVAISSGTVNIGTISGSVTIASGSVDIGSGNITIVGGQGGLTNVGTYLPPVSLWTLDPLTTSPTTKTVALPVGTQAVKVTFWDNWASIGNVTILTVRGTTTSTYYLDAPLPGEDVIILSIDAITDPSVTFVVQGAVGGGGITAVALIGNAAIDVGDSPNDPLWVQTSPNLPLAVIGPDGTVILTTGTLPVELGTLSMANGQQAVSGSYTLPANGAGVLVVTPANATANGSQVLIVGINGGPSVSKSFLANGGGDTFLTLAGATESPVTVVVTWTSKNLTGSPIPAATVYALIVPNTVDIGSGNITVVGGQGGQTNVSIDAPPVSIGTLTILSGHNTATLTANLGNNWTGIVVQVVDEGDTGILQFGVEIVVYDAAGGPVYGDTWSLKSAGNAIVVPITGNIDGGTGTFTVTVGTGGYAVVTNTVVAHVGALLGTGIQYVTTPPLQAINVVPGLGNGVVNWANYQPVAALTWYQVLAFNSVRRGLLLYANWTNAAHCAIGIGSNFPSYFLGPGAYYEMPLPIQTASIAAYWDILPTGGLVTTAGLLNTEVT
jgi:hypothetical protein